MVRVKVRTEVLDKEVSWDTCAWALYVSKVWYYCILLLKLSKICFFPFKFWLDCEQSSLDQAHVASLESLKKAHGTLASRDSFHSKSFCTVTMPCCHDHAVLWCSHVISCGHVDEHGTAVLESGLRWGSARLVFKATSKRLRCRMLGLFRTI